MPKTTGKENTSPQLRAFILRRHEEGMSNSDIASFVGTTTRTIQRILKNYQERGHHDDAPRSGRPPKLSERDMRRIKYDLEGNRRQSLANITASYNATATSPVHPHTIQHAINNQLGLNSRVAAKKPYLKPAHKHTWLIWARQHRQWGEEDWKHIIWTDEASVEIGKGSERVWVWRRPGERHLDQCLIPTFKSGRQSLMVWGCIAYGRRGPLIRIPKDQKKGVDYINLILGGPLLDFYMELSEERGQVAVMEDGAPVHRCKLARKFREDHQMQVFPHPAQSPDINPIEHVWKHLKVKINQRLVQPKNLDQLWGALLEEWERIDTGFINSLVDSMSDRVEAVHKAHGGSTKY